MAKPLRKADRDAVVSRLFHTSVDDCKISIKHHDDPEILLDLLIKCYEDGHISREQIVRRRIAELIRSKNG